MSAFNTPLIRISFEGYSMAAQGAVAASTQAMTTLRQTLSVPRLTLTTSDGLTHFPTVDELMHIAKVRNSMCNDVRPITRDFAFLSAPPLNSRGRLGFPTFSIVGMPTASTRVLQPLVEDDSDEEDFEDVVQKDFTEDSPAPTTPRPSYLTKQLSFLFTRPETAREEATTPGQSLGLALRRVPSRLAHLSEPAIVEDGETAVIEEQAVEAMEELSMTFRSPSVLKRPRSIAAPRTLDPISEEGETDFSDETTEAASEARIFRAPSARQLRRDSLPRSTFERYLARSRMSGTSGMLDEDSDDSNSDLESGSDAFWDSDGSAGTAETAPPSIGSVSSWDDCAPLFTFSSGRRDSASSDSSAYSVFSASSASSKSYYFDDEFDTDSEDECDDAYARRTFRSYLTVEAAAAVESCEGSSAVAREDNYAAFDEEDDEEWETISIAKGQRTTGHHNLHVSSSSFPAPPPRQRPTVQDLADIKASSLGLPIFIVPAHALLSRSLAMQHPEIALPMHSTASCPTPPTSPTRSTF